MPKITLEKLQTIIEKIGSRIVKSNDIVDRIKYPYYQLHESAPEQLTSFKEKLVVYRALSSELTASSHKSSIYKTWLSSYADFNDLSRGSFFHGVVGNLVVSSFGIGECSECSTLLAIELANGGFGNLAFISVRFSNAKPGMETGHQFIITNLPKMPAFPPGAKITLDKLFASLPKDAFIGDAFLGICFSPQHIPEIYHRYIHAYGGKAEVDSCRHFFNLTERSFGGYLSVAADIKARLKQKETLPTLGVFASPESWKKQGKNFLLEQKEHKNDYVNKEKDGAVTLSIKSEKVKKYVDNLDYILGEGRGHRIVQKNIAGTCVSFPSFWLRQLSHTAIQELANNLEVDPEQLSVVEFSMEKTYRSAIVHPASRFFASSDTKEEAAVSVTTDSSITHPAYLELKKTL